MLVHNELVLELKRFFLGKLDYLTRSGAHFHPPSLAWTE